MKVIADIDLCTLVESIEEDVEAIATLATDAEITRQFETIQKELEGVITQHLKEYIKEQIVPTLGCNCADARNGL